MSQQIKNKVARLHGLHQLLQQNVVTLLEIQQYYKQEGLQKSIRQIHRDLHEVLLLLAPTEQMASHYVGKTKYYQIHCDRSSDTAVEFAETVNLHTNFYVPKWNDIDLTQLQLIKDAIKTGHVIQVGKLKNDETGDNFSFTTKQIQLIPVSIITHRNSYFVGGYNAKEKVVVFYSIRQLVNLKTLPLKCTPASYQKAVQLELNGRFGITKNINSEQYTIRIEVANVMSEFLQNHNWHPSQQFIKKRGKTTLLLHCGINRELMGWLLQWMYNIKIIEPPVLKSYFEKTLQEITAVHTAKKTLVYRNIFAEE